MNQPEFEYLGPYRVVQTLGRGGMGTVYKGVHARSGEVIAIKVIAIGVANSPRFRRRFDAEIETLQRLKHPNIVQLVGFGEEQGMLFYTMEYVEGQSLHEHLRQHTKMPFSDVIQIGIETASALKHAHDFGIIHRDLKPANLMLTQDGRIKLTDFGIAKLFGSTDMTALGSVIGTADYMPPEQAEGKAVTVRSDLYSLGSVLYALLAGRAPFGGKTVPEVLYSVRYSSVPSLDDRVAGLPSELVTLINELLEKDPGKRPPTALVVGNRLKSMQQGLQKFGATDDGSQRPTSVDTKQKIGTHLTSLDLSEADEDELRLTGEEISQLGLDNNRAADETYRGSGEGTHEQQTMLAPKDAPLPPFDDSPVDSDYSARRESEFSAEIAAPATGIGTSRGTAESPIGTQGQSRYTPVDAKDRNQGREGDSGTEPSQTIDWLQIGSIAGIALILISSVGFVVWMLIPRSADELYEEIQLATESGDENQIVAAQPLIEEYLDRFGGGEHSDELRTLSSEFELVRRTKILRKRAARMGGNTELSAVEQAFLDCMDARERDAALAQEKAAALLAVFGAVENLPTEEQKLVELVEAAALSQRTSQSPDPPLAVQQLEKLIQSAEKMMSPEQLSTYYHQLLVLYGDKPWASAQVNRIKKKLSSGS